MTICSSRLGAFSWGANSRIYGKVKLVGGSSYLFIISLDQMTLMQKAGAHFIG